MASTHPCAILSRAGCNRFLASIGKDPHPKYKYVMVSPIALISKCDICILWDEDPLNTFISSSSSRESHK